ncbi:MAG: c-type cytochrome, partial [Opitutales bacterium]
RTDPPSQAIDRRSLEHGQTLFNAHCAPCHGYTGHGDGIVVRRGFPEPPSFHTDRLRRAPAGYLYTVLNEGYGVMLPYGQRISRDERWRVIAYLRTLQLTQYATAEHVPRRIWASLAEEQEETQ